MKTTRLAALLLAPLATLVPVASGSLVLYSEDFTTQTPGERPASESLTQIRPFANNQIAYGEPNAVGVAVVTDFGVPGNNALHLWDYNPGSSNAQALVERTFVSDADSQQSTIRFDFSFQRYVDLSPAHTGDALYVAIGAYNPSMTMQFRKPTAPWRCGSSMTAPTASATGRQAPAGETGALRPLANYSTTGVNSVSLFVNTGPALGYLAPDGNARTLNANSFDVFLNNDLVADNLELVNSLFHNGSEHPREDRLRERVGPDPQRHRFYRG
jgi:hypothetical protein